MTWYGAFPNRPPVYLVHGEPAAQQALARKMQDELGAAVTIAERGQVVSIQG